MHIMRIQKDHVKLLGILIQVKKESQQSRSDLWLHNNLLRKDNFTTYLKINYV